MVAGESVAVAEFGRQLQADAVAELQLLDGLLAHAIGVEVLARGHGGLLDEAVGDRSAEGVVVDDVFERDGTFRGFNEWRGGQFETEDRFQLVDRSGSGTGAVAEVADECAHQAGLADPGG